MKIRLSANAKINLAINVGEKLQNGYHNVDMIMQSVTLCDYLEVESTDQKEDISFICDDESLSGDDNILMLAIEEFNKIHKIDFGLKISLQKNIPVAAGLAGGSADAGAMLVALNILSKAHLDRKNLEDIATKIGADVPFMITGGTKRIGGIGEKLKDLKDFPNCYIILVKNAEKLSTGYMYGKLDSQKGRKQADIDSLQKAIDNENLLEISKYVENDFCAVWDNKVLDVIKELKDLGALTSNITGSGPTVFGLFKDINSATSAYQKLKGKYNEVYLTNPSKKSIEIFK